jgi:hypothetical protein
MTLCIVILTLSIAKGKNPRIGTCLCLFFQCQTTNKNAQPKDHASAFTSH